MRRFSRRAYLRGVLAGSTTATVGCLDSFGGGTALPSHELLVLWNAAGGRPGGTGRVFSAFTFDPDDGRYGDRVDWAPERQPARIPAVAPFAEGYAVVSVPTDEDPTLSVLDASATVRTSTDLGADATIATDDDHIYTVTAERIVVFDRDLNRLGTADLPENLRGKHMEDAIFYDGVAYVVDNEIYPLYLMQVDLQDPTNPAVRDVLARSGSNLHLGPQCLDPASNRWLFSSSTSHREGGTQRVIATSMDATGDDREFTTEEVSTYDRETGQRSGVHVDDLASRSPVFATVTRDETHYLSSVSVDPTAEDGGQIGFGTERELPNRAPLDTIDETVVTVTRTQTGCVGLGYDADRDTVRFEQELECYGLEAVDVLVA